MPNTFRPHLLLPSGHLQTLATTIMPMPKVAYAAIKHRVELGDGDVIVLHDDCPADWQAGDPVAILLHGLCGCHASAYMVRMADKLNRAAVRVFRMDMRGCGAGRELATGLPHSGRSGDLLAAANFVASECPESPIWPIGISMGGNIVLKFLGELGNQTIVPEFPASRVARAAAVAPPIDPARCCRNLSRPTLRLYGQYFIRKLRSRVPPLVAQRSDWQAINWDPVPRTLWDFDDLVTAPLSGFNGVDDYYAQAASAPLAHHISVPTMILLSQDDPIIPIGCFHDVQWPENVQLRISRRGGHVGFIGMQKLPTGDRYWMDAQLMDWFSSERATTSQSQSR